MVSVFPNLISQIRGEPPVVSTFLGFLEANGYIAEDLVNDILPALARGEEFHGGRAAGAEFSVRAARPDELPPLPTDTAGMHALLAAGGPGDEPDWPDISEMVEAIEAAQRALARLGTLSGHMMQTLPLSALAEFDGQRQEALARCRHILDRINAMQQEAPDAH